MSKFPEITVVVDEISEKMMRNSQNELVAVTGEYQLQGWYNNSSLTDLVGDRIDSRTGKRKVLGVRFTWDFKGEFSGRAYIHSKPTNLYDAFQDAFNEMDEEAQKDRNNNPTLRLRGHAKFLATLLKSIPEDEFPTGVAMKVKPVRAFKMVKSGDQFILEVEDDDLGDDYVLPF